MAGAKIDSSIPKKARQVQPELETHFLRKI
jgi:hypothetical protein